MEKYDYLIAGGGPAGAVTAFCLQKKGFRCLIVEKRNKIDEKICGGLLSWKGVAALSQIGLNPLELLEYGATVIRSFTYIRNGQTTVYRYNSGECGLGVRRQLLDQWLLDNAVSNGTDVKMGVSLKQVIQDNELLKLSDNFAKHLVIATGAACYPETVRAEQSFGLSVQITGSTNLMYDSVYFFMIGGNGPDYVWAIPNGEGIWNIGIWFQKLPDDPITQFYSNYHSVLEQYFTDVTFIRQVRGAFCGNVRTPVSPIADCTLVGDAAGTNDYNTGEGLSQAIESAIRLSEKMTFKVPL